MVDHGITLSGALTTSNRTWPLLGGAVTSPRLDMRWSAVSPGEMFWRQLKFADFDVSEMSLSSLAIATARGSTEWTALPVFTSRSFFHTGILVRADAGIATAADLRGKRVGVLEYQQTSVVWIRGFLEHECGIRAQDLAWFMERAPAQSHGGSTGFAPPAGVQLSYIPASTSMAEMILAGDLDALLFYPLDTAASRDLVDRARPDLAGDPRVVPLYPDGPAEGRRYLEKTGIFPLNHCVVVRRSVAERAPGVVEEVFALFQAANAALMRRRSALLGPHLETGAAPAAVGAALQHDPYAYGMRATGRTVDALLGYLAEQHLSPRVVRADEIFAAAMLTT